MPPGPTITLTAANSGKTLAATAYRFQGEQYTAESDWNDMEIRDDKHKNLRLFKNLIENDQITHSFKHFLGSEQVTSCNLINNWLSGSLQPEESKDWAKEAIASETFNHQNLWDLQRLYSLSPKTFPTSHYQFHHLLLFQIEFTYYVLTPEGSSDWLQVLSNRRRNAQNYATSQLLAHRLFCNKTLPKDSPQRFPPLPGMQDVCPWLSDSADKDELPVYLWDTELNATLQACELDERPQYICISHTWGRWKSGRSIRLQNVPWDIPCNNIFDVEMLPNHLHDSARANGYRYVWFDLVCIPQERGNTKLAEVARSEISRQALIFRNAAICLCWLNYIDDWSAERATLDFLSSFFYSTQLSTGNTTGTNLHSVPERMLKNGCSFSSILTTNGFWNTQHSTIYATEGKRPSSLQRMPMKVHRPDIILRVKVPRTRVDIAKACTPHSILPKPAGETFGRVLASE
ncbi:hypothetical protein EDB80DRAFT_871506 [Ilyonectria destructans]|nr:hypothetical protein EDB80DRAFT_871506 [Ilyonectria destructans]